MNKILLGKKIVSESDKVKITGNKIYFLADGLYEVEYVEDKKNEIDFIVDGNVTILEYGFGRHIENNNKYVVKSGELTVNKFYDNEEVLEKVDICLESIDSSIDYKFSSICRQVEEYVINVNHKEKDTKSNIVNKAVACEGSKISYVINSNVPKRSNGSVLEQNTRIVTMGDSDAKICPNMFIDLDDVSAKHGSVIGTFKDDDIFYLMSKGISYRDTLKLLIKGFLLSNSVENHEIRKKIIDIIDLYWR